MLRSQAQGRSQHLRAPGTRGAEIGWIPDSMGHLPRRRRHQARGRAEIEAHLLLQSRQVEPDEIGKAALQHEIRHAAGKLGGLVCVPAKADRQFAGAAVDRDPLLRIGEHVGQLIAEAAVANAEIVCKADRPRPGRQIPECLTQNVAQDRR